ncbi:MAG: asparagine synthase-related protein [Steroidobacteraceae bacterium]
MALLSDPASGDWSVLRDCSGMIPCYYTSLHDVTIVFSDVRDLRLQPRNAAGDAWLVPFDVNWRYIAGFLAASQLQIRETGFNDVYELLAGESLDSTAGRRSAHISWNPVSVAETDPLRNVEDACRELRDTTRRCIETWAGVHHRVIHSLSGGFDSSLVLALLMRAAKQPEVVAVNRFASGPGEDERRYARKAAQAAGVELLELPYEVQSFEAACSEIPATVKPTITQAFAGLEAKTEAVLAVSQSVEDVWTGQGGDHLFMAIKTGMIVADCFRNNGLGLQLRTVFRDAATLTGRSYLHLARDARALRHAKNFFSVAGIRPSTHFLAAGYPLEDLDIYTHHPWTSASAALPPAKRLQVIYLAEVLNRHRPNYGIQKLQEFHPLLSQPLIELCLRIPVYHLLTTGKTRGLARKAFQTDLPPAIRDRQQKGQTTHQAVGLLRDNRPFMTDRLLDGRLADQRLVSREALRTILEPHASIAGPTLFSLLACVAAELWLEDWLGSKLARGFPAHSGMSAAGCAPQ